MSVGLSVTLYVVCKYVNNQISLQTIAAVLTSDGKHLFSMFLRSYHKDLGNSIISQLLNQIVLLIVA